MKKILLLPIVAALLSACSTSFTEDVVINSQPEGADVFLNNELVGQTPTNLTLAKDGVYEIRLAKKGYKDELVNLASVRQNSFIKFGPLVDMGYYKELTPDPVDADLSPSFLPAYPGINAFGDMTSNILEADKLRKEGKISADEHTHLIKKITEFYSQASAKK